MLSHNIRRMLRHARQVSILCAMSGLPDTIALPSGPAPITWRRSARARRISLRIEPRGGGVIVTLPALTPASAGRALLMTHTDWVAERLARLPQQVALQPGAEVPVAGRPHRIVHLPGARGGAWIEGQELHVTGGPDAITLDCLDQRTGRTAVVAPRRDVEAGSDLVLHRLGDEV